MKINAANVIKIACLVDALVFNFLAAQTVAASSFDTNALMNFPRRAHTATLLSDGKVLVAGGEGLQNSNVVFTTGAELYDPSTGNWQVTGAMTNAHAFHTATLLPNGKVLVAGGVSFASAEIYDPASGTWTKTGSMNSVRYQHTANLLPNGKVLVSGGNDDSGNSLSSAELYDPVTGVWTYTGTMNDARWSHSSALLPNGKVLVAGGGAVVNNVSFALLSSAEIYDPATGAWTSATPLNAGRFDHAATLLPDEKVLVIGGFDNFNSLSSTELYDPIAGTWTNGGALNIARDTPTSTLLPDGKLLVAGGYGDGGIFLSSTEIFDPNSRIWTTNGAMSNSRWQQTATVLANGKVLFAGGYDGTNYVAGTETYDLAINPATGAWTNTGHLNTAHQLHTATLLPNGLVLLTGGDNGSLYPTNSELYDENTGGWTLTGATSTTRELHTATLLPSGKVLIAGGYDKRGSSFPVGVTELFDPSSQTWTNTGSLNTPRFSHTATLLPGGKVLVTGGNDGLNRLASSELYDPATGIWTATGNLTNPRQFHTATVMLNGKVLVTGGSGTNGVVSATEIFDPVSGLWTTTNSLTTARTRHAAALLPNGKVLVAGGSNSLSASLSSAELYDPATGMWTSTGSMTTNRLSSPLLLLPDGKVLIAGGATATPPASAELYDPATGTWTPTGSLNTRRSAFSLTILRSGKILIAGGRNEISPFVLDTTELYDAGLGFTNSSRPQISGIASSLNLGSSLAITGTKFRGVSEGSSGNCHDSPADFPLVQLRSIESGQTTFLLCTNWSANSVSTESVSNFPVGYALATIFANGIPSTSSIVNLTITGALPVAPVLTGVMVLNDGSFRFTFASTAGTSFQALTTTNLSLPLSDWTSLGNVPEISPGQFQFTDPQATGHPQRFYRVRSP